MAWKNISTDDVYRRLTEDEVTKIKLYVPVGQPDIILAEIQSCSNMARGYLPKYVQREDGYAIPEEMEDAVLSLIVYRLASRLPTKVILTEARTLDRQDAKDFLTAVQHGDISVSITSNPSDEPLQQPIPRFSTNDRARTMRYQEGRVTGENDEYLPSSGR